MNEIDCTSELLEGYHKKMLNVDITSIPDNLLSGKLGLTLYFLALYQATNQSCYLEKIEELLEAVFENCNNTQNKDNLYLESTLGKGITGLVYILDLLIRDRLIEESEYIQFIDDANELIYEQTLQMIGAKNFTYFNGPIGNLFYFITIGDLEKCNTIINLLYQECVDADIPFYTQMNDSYADGINLGFNYGYLSIINVLLLYGLYSKKVIHIINTCFQIIISNLSSDYQVKGVNIYKPYNLTKKGEELEPYHNNRLCWCNSDLSFAYMLYKAGEKLNNDEYLQLGLEIGMETTKRKKFENTGIESVHFCHGTSGITQLFMKLTTFDENSLYLKTKMYWRNKTLDFLKSDINKKMELVDYSLLFGNPGALMVVDDKINIDKYLNFLLCNGLN